MVNKLNTLICNIGAALLGYIQRFAGSAIRGSIPTGSGRWRSRNVASRVHLGSGREDTETFQVTVRNHYCLKSCSPGFTYILF